MAEFETDYLAHYGVDGQKWGVRNGPPYPISRSSNGDKKNRIKNTAKKLYESHKQKRAENKENAKKNARKLLKKFVRNHPELLPAFAAGMTRDEVDDVIKNIEYDRKLNQIRDYELDRKWRNRQRTANNIGTVSSLINNSKNLYNNSIEIANHLRPADKQIRKIGEKKEADRSQIIKIVRTGTAKQVFDNLPNLTSKELQDAMSRLNYQDQLNKRMTSSKE